jgi:hypothetical protein
VNIQRFSISLIILIGCLGWATAPAQPSDEGLSILVRRCVSHDGESSQKWEAGVIWSFSYIGATWPKGSFRDAVKPIEPFVYEINFRKMGLPPAAEPHLAFLLDSLKSSAEYQERCAIDLGRLLMLTVYSSWHYYRLSGAAPRYQSVLNQLQATDSVLVFPAAYSSVAKGNRILHLQRGKGPFFTYVAEEGYGSLPLDNFSSSAFEAFTVMPNGQFRYAIYDHSGQLEAATPTQLAGAGKPTKCQWCHESNLLPLYRPTHNIAGFATTADFTREVARHQAILNRYRSSLSTEINYANGTEEHAFAEILYVSFMEPSAERLAAEWGWSAPEVQQYLKGLPTHQHPEFPQLGTLYHRADVDKMAPYPTLKVPTSAREAGYEPNFWQSDPSQ